MLCQFTFKNYKSYRDEAVLDLQATSFREHSDSLLANKDDKKVFLPLSVIYGPNAGGKSGVLEALASLISQVMLPIDFIKKTPHLLSLRQPNCPTFSFNNNAKNAPTEFAVFFRNKNYEYRYALAVMKSEVISESLFRKKLGGKVPAKIFERDLTDIQLGATFKRSKINKNVNSQMPYISFLAINYELEPIDSAIDWFSKCIFVNYANPNMYSSTVINADVKDALLRALHDVDIPISDYSVKLETDDKSGQESIDSIHILRKINGEEYALDFLDESRGTVKLFDLLQLALISLLEGRLLIVDELDAILHPKLLEYIIKLFKQKTLNKNYAQLLFTSHDISTLRNDVFRRDEIWFASKDDEGSSELYSLCEIRNTDGSHIKSSAPFGKQYMDGRYGADPFLSEMLSVKWEN